MKPQPLSPNEVSDVDPEEVQAASDDTPTDVTSPELSDQTKDLTGWDDVPSATGIEAPKMLPDDEVPAAQQLVEEGLDEADREQRLAAADPDFEP